MNSRTLVLLSFVFYLLSCGFTAEQEDVLNPGIKDIPKKVFDDRVYDSSLSKKDEVTLQGRVVKVTDGDTIDLLVDGKAVRIRLSHIDAPEKRNGQPYWRASRNRLGELCEGQEIVVKGQNELDRYKRFLGELYTIEGVNINKVLVAEGLAWHYKAYSDQEIYSELEFKAKKHRLGLWKEKNPIAPWEWRKLKKDEIQAMNL